MVRKNRRGAKWMMIHIALVVLWFLGSCGLLGVAGALFPVGWQGRWSVVSVVQLTGSVVFGIAALYAFIVVPIRIEKLTGREVFGGYGGDGGGGGGGDCS